MRHLDLAQASQGSLEVLDGVDLPVLECPARKQMGVADVGDDVAGVGVLAQGFHGCQGRGA